MTSLLEILKNAAGTTLMNKAGDREEFRLLPALEAEELLKLEAALPCPLPEETRSFFAVTQGCECGDLGIVDFAGLPGGLGLEEVFPRALSIAGDESGNFWVIDLTADSRTWGPIYYACHDAPVIVYQTDSPAHFVEEALRGENAPWKSELRDVHDNFGHEVWGTNPGVLSHEECANSSDADLREFARSLDASFEFIDLRAPKLGDGFSWGRYGSRFVVKRYGEKRIFANQRKSKWQRLREALK